MRAIHEAKKRGLAKVTTSEIRRLFTNALFVDKDGNFSRETFGLFKTNFLARPA